jgi:glycosyltransferase involved in cell wall biosynthesis
MNISILIITHKRPKLLQKCLESIHDAHKSFKVQIIILFNGDRKNYQEYKEKSFPNDNTQIIYTNKKKNGEARNLAINNSKSDWICFLDDDVEIPINYFDEAKNTIEDHFDVSVFGGPDITNLNPSIVQKAFGLVQQSPLAMGPTYKRHTPVGVKSHKTSEMSLILCNLWIKRSLLGNGPNQFLFNPKVNRNEENILLNSMNNSNMIYDPKLFVRHYRKNSLRKLLLAISQSGYNRARSFYLAPKNFNFIYAIPAIFCAYLAIILLFPSNGLLLPLSLYFILLIFECSRILFLTKNGIYFFTSFILIPLIHISYGISFFAGALHRLRNK